MKSNQKLSLLFWLFKAKATKDGNAPLYVRITIDGEDTELSLGRKVFPDFWNVTNKSDMQTGLYARETNRKIREADVDLNRLFDKLALTYEKVTPTMLKNAYLGLDPMYQKGKGGIKEPDQIDYLIIQYADFIKKFGRQVEKGNRSAETLKHWKSAKTKLQEFIKFQYQIEDIELKEVRYSFAEKFYDYMTLEVDEPLSEITAKGQVKKLKQILKGCVQNDLISKNPIANFVCSGGDKDVEPLEMVQVQLIYNKEISIPRLAEVRDAFIFQCFTGFAYQDVYALCKDNIVHVGLNGERWLIKDRGKTNVSEMVPILPIVDEIIEKYKNHPYCVKNNCLLPINSNSRYNGYLKEIAAICDIKAANAEDRELNTHKARHTFADIMLNSGVPLEDVSKMLGHKSIRTTQRYCKVRKPRISENVAKAKSVLFTITGQLKQINPGQLTA